VTPLFAQTLATVNIVVQGAMLLGTMLALSHQVRTAQDALATEHARSEALMDNLLPTEIAARLKSGPGQVIADDLPAVTILFADIVDFTPRNACQRGQAEASSGASACIRGLPSLG
jgi:adenylate cyclase/guanylate cyclase